MWLPSLNKNLCLSLEGSLDQYQPSLNENLRLFVESSFWIKDIFIPDIMILV